MLAVMKDYINDTKDEVIDYYEALIQLYEDDTEIVNEEEYSKNMTRRSRRKATITKCLSRQKDAKLIGVTEFWCKGRIFNNGKMHYDITELKPLGRYKNARRNKSKLQCGDYDSIYFIRKRRYNHANSKRLEIANAKIKEYYAGINEECA